MNTNLFGLENLKQQIDDYCYTQRLATITKPIDLVGYFTFYFPNQLLDGNRVKAVVEDYVERYTDHLDLLLLSKPNGKFKPFNKKSYTQLCDKQLPELINRTWELIIMGGEILNDYQGSKNASCFFIEVVSNHKCSNININFPVTYFLEHPDDAKQLFVDYSQLLQATHATGGLGLISTIDHNSRRFMLTKIVNSLSKQYPGLDLCDSYSQWYPAQHGLLPINWLTMINNDYLEKIGGVENIEQTLQSTPSTYTPYDGGVVLCASSSPFLCENEADGSVPLDYKRVAELVKFVRVSPQYTWSIIGYSSEDYQMWGNRFG